jgi:hypothetical protein
MMLAYSIVMGTVYTTIDAVSVSRAIRQPSNQTLIERRTPGRSDHRFRGDLNFGGASARIRREPAKLIDPAQACPRASGQVEPDA